MSPGAKSGAEDADGRERRMKRRSRRDLAVQPEMLLPLEGRHDGHDLSDVLSRNDTACGVPIRVAAPYRSPGVPKQGVQGGMLPSLPVRSGSLLPVHSSILLTGLEEPRNPYYRPGLFVSRAHLHLMDS